MNFEPHIQELKTKLTDGPERVGFVLKTGEVVEVQNICAHSDNGFEVSGADLVKYHDQVAATWHTHPSQNSNLSTNDWYGFRNYPEWLHLIIGTDGVSSYRVDQGRVLTDQKWANEG